MTRVSFQFVRFNTENRTIEQKSTEIQREMAVNPSKVQMPVFGCSSRCHPRNHFFRPILNKRAQRQIFEQKITEIAKVILLVHALDQGESRAMTERIIKDGTKGEFDFRELSAGRRKRTARLNKSPRRFNGK
jgi:hypothetical protein